MTHVITRVYKCRNCGKKVEKRGLNEYKDAEVMVLLAEILKGQYSGNPLKIPSHRCMKKAPYSELGLMDLVAIRCSDLVPLKPKRTK